MDHAKQTNANFVVKKHTKYWNIYHCNLEAKMVMQYDVEERTVCTIDALFYF